MRFWRKRQQRRGSDSNYGVRARQSIVLKPVFGETIPHLADMDDRTLYVSMRFATLSHLCPCGCGRLVDVTLDPETRSLTYDGEFLTLRPSIGVKFPCRSHYSIIRNSIVWSDPISNWEAIWYDRFKVNWRRPGNRSKSRYLSKKSRKTRRQKKEKF